MKITSLCFLLLAAGALHAQTDLAERVAHSLCRTGFLFEVPTAAGEENVPNCPQDVPTDTECNRQLNLGKPAAGLVVVLSPEPAFYRKAIKPAALFTDRPPPRNRRNERIRRIAAAAVPQSYLGGRL